MTGEPIQAVLWDVDGLLVDREPGWTLAEHVLAARCGAVSPPRAPSAGLAVRSSPALLSMGDLQSVTRAAAPARSRPERGA